MVQQISVCSKTMKRPCVFIVKPVTMVIVWAWEWLIEPVWIRCHKIMPRRVKYSNRAVRKMCMAVVFLVRCTLRVKVARWTMVRPFDSFEWHVSNHPRIAWILVVHIGRAKELDRISKRQDACFNSRAKGIGLSCAWSLQMTCPVPRKTMSWPPNYSKLHVTMGTAGLVYVLVNNTKINDARTGIYSRSCLYLQDSAVKTSAECWSLVALLSSNAPSWQSRQWVIGKSSSTHNLRRLRKIADGSWRYRFNSNISDVVFTVCTSN